MFCQWSSRGRYLFTVVYCNEYSYSFACVRIKTLKLCCRCSNREKQETREVQKQVIFQKWNWNQRFIWAICLSVLNSGWSSLSQESKLLSRSLKLLIFCNQFFPFFAVQCENDVFDKGKEFHPTFSHQYFGDKWVLWILLLHPKI